MNYFEFYDIPITFALDSDQLKIKFLEIGRKYHPDFYTMASSEEKERALQISTLNNEAFKTLTNRNARIAHILRIYGLLSDEESHGLSTDFLMEMMEFNEKLAELEFEPNQESKERLLVQIFEKSKIIEKDAIRHMEEWDTDGDASHLDSIKQFYLKTKYINRILQKVKE